MTFIEKFDYFKETYAKNADITKFEDSFVAAQITMTDDDCKGTFYAAFIDGKFSFEPYDYHDNTVAVIISSELLEQCIKGEADPVKCYLDSRLNAWGNLNHALNLIECLKGNKKSTAKDSEKKKESADSPEKVSKSRCKKAKAETSETSKEVKNTKKETAKKPKSTKASK